MGPDFERIEAGERCFCESITLLKSKNKYIFKKIVSAGVCAGGQAIVSQRVAILGWGECDDIFAADGRTKKGHALLRGL